MSKKIAKVHYQGSIFWLIFWCIFFFPVAFALLLTSSTFMLNQTTYSISYEGSKFWLCFWVLIFFPIALLLIALKGVCIMTEGPFQHEDV